MSEQQQPENRFPWKVDDGYPCRARTPGGEWLDFEDLLQEGQKVGHGDGEGNVHPPFGLVVRREDGLCGGDWMSEQQQPEDDERIALLTWVKPGLGTGPFFRTNTEQIIFGVRGKLELASRSEPTAFVWPRRGHSEKPDAFYDLVERVSPGPYAELFARRARFGWDYPIGDQALGGVAA